MLPLQVLDVRLGVHGLSLGEPLGLGGRDAEGDLLGHLARHFTLQVEHVFEIAVVAIAPQRLVPARRNELHTDADALPEKQGRALDDGVYVQLARDVGERLVHALVAHGAGARDDAQALQPREVRDERLRHAVHEVFLGRIVRDVFERQHGQRADPLVRGAGRPLFDRALEGAQLLQDVACRLVAIARRLGQAAIHQQRQLAGNVGSGCIDRRRRIAQDRRAQLGQGFSAKRPPADCELVDQDAEREEIRAAVHGFTLQQLGCHVGGCPEELTGRGSRGLHSGCGTVRRSGIRHACELGQPEVEHFHASFARHHHVRRLQVAMDDAAFVCGDEGVGHGDRQLEKACERKPTRRDEFCETLSLDQLHGEEANTVLVLDGVERHDVGMIEPRHGARLPLEAGEAVGVRGYFGGQHLERHLAPQSQVLGAIHLAHPAGADLGDDLVVAEPEFRGDRHAGRV